MHPKKLDDSFVDKFDLCEPWRGFQEGNAIQYTFYVPHDPAALIAAVGRDSFNARPDHIFTSSAKDGFGGG